MIKVSNSKIKLIHLERTPYKEVWNLQKKLQQERIKEKINDTIILTEHEPVYTLGKNANVNHLLPNRDRNIEVFNIERGGDITFHGPGQLVGYPILCLKNYKPSITWYMRTLEQVIIDTLKNFSISATRRRNFTGVWVGDEKIAAMGVRISRWVTMHGFSININPDLKFYEGIIPCGIFEFGVTSMKELGVHSSMNTVKSNLIKNLFKYFLVDKI
ncbi:MAG: lipoyl(octanoyl) transferase [Candidatus Marinimicrobia bacterium]|nr:lipoyl(octanoyl) transferase [Candidatus Neomarinimicrobiota bacterium]